MIASIQEFLDAFVRWAGSRPDIQGAALVGSHARGAASENSDVDLVILTASREPYLRDTAWTRAFGETVGVREEHYGQVTSLRVTYAGGREVEFGFAAPEWSARPIDAETAKVLRAGMRILYDPAGIMAAMQHDVHQHPPG